MKNFEEKEIKDLSTVIGGETEGFKLSNEEVIHADGTVTVKLDLTWVSKK